MCNSCNSWRFSTSFVWPKYRLSSHQFIFLVSQFWNELNFSKLVYLCWKRLLFGTVLKFNGLKTEFRSKTKLKRTIKKRAIRDPTWFFTKMCGNSSFHSNERNYSKLALAMGSGSRTWDKGVSDAARNILCPKCVLELAAIQKTKQRIGSTEIGS